MRGTAVFPINMIRLCIDGYGNDLSGRVYSKLMPAPLLFSGCGKMLLKTDALFERAGYPQAFQERRTFGETARADRQREGLHKPEQMMKDEELDRQSGSLRTFDIVVQSRRQSGWQGILMDPGRTTVRRFSSEMELLDCICEVLGSGAARGAEIPRKRTFES